MYSPGLNFVVDMKPQIVLRSRETDNIPYTIKVSTETDVIDQKRDIIELKPGYHIMIRVTPTIIETSKNFEKYDFQTRKCKLNYESKESTILRKYSRTGCEYECAMSEASKICQCLPWFYPNNFSVLPMCEMFGAKCFDMIMSNEDYYKKCSEECLEDCKGTSYVAVSSYVPIDAGAVCRQPLFDSFFDKMCDRGNDIYQDEKQSKKLFCFTFLCFFTNKKKSCLLKRQQNLNLESSYYYICIH